MRHRHLVDGIGYHAAVVEDILRRAKPADWVVLRDAVLADPIGEVAQTVLDIRAATKSTGRGRFGQA